MNYPKRYECVCEAIFTALRRCCQVWLQCRFLHAYRPFVHPQSDYDASRNDLNTKVSVVVWVG